MEVQSDMTHWHTSIRDEIADKVRKLENEGAVEDYADSFQ
jgi:hypothetical protein